MSISVEVQQAELQHRVDELSGTVEQLQRELEQLRQREAVQQSGSRRDLLKVVGGAAAGVLVGSGAGPSPAQAATGDFVYAGWSVGATNSTRIRNGTFAPALGTPLTSDATMFWIDNRLSTLAAAIGVRGDGKGVNGTGVWGNSDSGGIGLFGSGGIGAWGSGAIGVKASGTVASAMLEGSNPAPPARSTRTLAARSTSMSTATCGCARRAARRARGARSADRVPPERFIAINPSRVFDSRFAGGSRIASGQNRLVSVANGYDVTTGLVNAPNVVPVGATAIAFNLTVTATAAQGFLTVAPGTATGIAASSINWRGDGLDIANGLIVQVDSSRQVRVFAGGGGNTDFLIDISGYYL